MKSYFVILRNEESQQKFDYTLPLWYYIDTLTRKEGEIPSFYFHLKEVSTLAQSDILLNGYEISQYVADYVLYFYDDEKIHKSRQYEFTKAIKFCKQLIRCSTDIDGIRAENSHRTRWIADAYVEVLPELPHEPSIVDIITKLKRIVDGTTIPAKEAVELKDFFRSLSELLKEKLGKYYRPNCCINLGLSNPTESEISDMRHMDLGF